MFSEDLVGIAKLFEAHALSFLAALSPLLFVYLYLVRSKLSHVPGPFLASITNLQRVYWVYTRKAHHTHIALHQKYGPLVRMGPNMVSVGDPAEIANIYDFTGKFLKVAAHENFMNSMRTDVFGNIQSDMYFSFQTLNRGKPVRNIFNTPDADLHRRLKKPIASIYSLTSLISFEPYVDSTTEVFFEQLDNRYAQTGKVCDFGTWLQRFAFDVIGEVTFSKRIGFLENADDVDGIMGTIWKFFERSAMVEVASF